MSPLDAARLGRGRVVRVNVLDPQGKNRKPRPAVVISTVEEAEATGRVVVVCVSTKHGQAPPEVQIELPHDLRGACRSGLREPSWAVATWIREVPIEDIETALGALTATLTGEIIALSNSLSDE